MFSILSSLCSSTSHRGRCGVIPSRTAYTECSGVFVMILTHGGYSLPALLATNFRNMTLSPYSGLIGNAADRDCAVYHCHTNLYENRCSGRLDLGDFYQVSRSSSRKCASSLSIDSCLLAGLRPSATIQHSKPETDWIVGYRKNKTAYAYHLMTERMPGFPPSLTALSFRDAAHRVRALTNAQSNFSDESMPN